MRIPTNLLSTPRKFPEDASARPEAGAWGACRKGVMTEWWNAVEPQSRIDGFA